MSRDYNANWKARPIKEEIDEQTLKLLQWQAANDVHNRDKEDKLTNVKLVKENLLGELRNLQENVTLAKQELAKEKVKHDEVKRKETDIYRRFETTKDEYCNVERKFKSIKANITPESCSTDSSRDQLLTQIKKTSEEFLNSKNCLSRKIEEIKTECRNYESQMMREKHQIGTDIEKEGLAVKKLEESVESLSNEVYEKGRRLELKTKEASILRSELVSSEKMLDTIASEKTQRITELLERKIEVEQQNALMERQNEQLAIELNDERKKEKALIVESDKLDSDIKNVTEAICEDEGCLAQIYDAITSTKANLESISLKIGEFTDQDLCTERIEGDIVEAKEKAKSIENYLKLVRSEITALNEVQNEKIGVEEGNANLLSNIQNLETEEADARTEVSSSECRVAELEKQIYTKELEVDERVKGEKELQSELNSLVKKLELSRQETLKFEDQNKCLEAEFKNVFTEKIELEKDKFLKSAKLETLKEKLNTQESLLVMLQNDASSKEIKEKQMLEELLDASKSLESFKKELDELSMAINLEETAKSKLSENLSNLSDGRRKPTSDSEPSERIVSIVNEIQEKASKLVELKDSKIVRSERLKEVLDKKLTEEKTVKDLRKQVELLEKGVDGVIEESVKQQLDCEISVVEDEIKKCNEEEEEYVKLIEAIDIETKLHKSTLSETLRNTRETKKEADALRSQVQSLSTERDQIKSGNDLKGKNVLEIERRINDLAIEVESKKKMKLDNDSAVTNAENDIRGASDTFQIHINEIAENHFKDVEKITVCNDGLLVEIASLKSKCDQFDIDIKTLEATRIEKVNQELKDVAEKLLVKENENKTKRIAAENHTNGVDVDENDNQSPLSNSVNNTNITFKAGPSKRKVSETAKSTAEEASNSKRLNSYDFESSGDGSQSSPVRSVTMTPRRGLSSLTPTPQQRLSTPTKGATPAPCVPPAATPARGAFGPGTSSGPPGRAPSLLRSALKPVPRLLSAPKPVPRQGAKKAKVTVKLTPTFLSVTEEDSDTET